MKQDLDHERKDDDKASVGGAFSMDFNFVDEDKTETVAGMTKQAEDEILKLEPPSAFIKTAHYLPESSSPGKTETTTKKL